jgi:hypothetical protein
VGEKWLGKDVKKGLGRRWKENVGKWEGQEKSELERGKEGVCGGRFTTFENVSGNKNCGGWMGCSGGPTRGCWKEEGRGVGDVRWGRLRGRKEWTF